MEDPSEEIRPDTFEQLGLKPSSMRAVKAAGYATPSPIQAAFIPLAAAGRDCIGQARTGTGKTAAFVLPALERIDHELLIPQVLVLAPTRELSEQVAEEARKLSQTSPVTVATCVGGKLIKKQVAALQAGAQLVVGTPGRVIDLINRQLLSLRKLRVVVLDEADRMLDIGFRPDIERILRSCPEDRQTLLLSATLPPPVERLARRYMKDPQRIDLSTDNVVVHSIDQYVVAVEEKQKFEALVKLLVQVKPRQAIVFCRMKRRADALYHRLAGRLKAIAAIHGDLQQAARDRAMKQFRDGSIRLLIATDVVGRGIDVSGVSHIINFDIPEYCDDYVHRVGRTGRLSSGDIGMAFTFASREEGGQLTNIEKRINRMLDPFQIEGFTPDAAPRRSYRERQAELAEINGTAAVETMTSLESSSAAAAVEEEDPFHHFGSGLV